MKLVLTLSLLLAGLASGFVVSPAQLNVQSRAVCATRADDPAMMPKFLKDLFGDALKKPEDGGSPFGTFMNMVQGKTEEEAKKKEEEEKPAEEEEKDD